MANKNGTSTRSNVKKSSTPNNVNMKVSNAQPATGAKPKTKGHGAQTAKNTTFQSANRKPSTKVNVKTGTKAKSNPVYDTFRDANSN